MKTYKITLRPLSSIITPFQADTIFGSICWALRYLRGKKELEEFLGLYSNELPPLLVSDGFPEGYYPRPVLKPISHSQAKALVQKYEGTGRKNLVEGLTKLKRLKKREYIPMEVFNELKNNLDESILLDRLYQLYEDIKCKSANRTAPDFKTTLVFRNTINRLTGTVLFEGGLHPDEEIFYPEKVDISIFAKTSLFSSIELREIFNFITLSGFGKSASSGKGALELIEVEEHSLPSAENPNTFMSLSSFIPKKNNPLRGYYQTMTKYGKLGGDYAKSPISNSDSSMNPFKKPLIMFKAGSVFFDDPPKEYYGRLIGDVHKDKKIKHYAYAFPVGVRVNEDI